MSLDERALLNTGTERNGTEYTGTTQNDAGMKRNGQEWYRNIPERAGMTGVTKHRNGTECTGICPKEAE